MVIVTESAAAALKGFIAQTGLAASARLMILRVALGFIGHRGRMSCTQAAVSVTSDTVHRGELKRFLKRPIRRKWVHNPQLHALLLAKESRRGKFIFLIDATLVSQAGKKSQNTFSTNNHNRGKRQKKVRFNRPTMRKSCKKRAPSAVTSGSCRQIPNASIKTGRKINRASARSFALV